MSNQKNIPPLNRDDPESLYNWVAYKISCPDFRNTIKDFINDNCTTFVDIKENSSNNDELFIQFKRLLDDLINDILHEGKISKEEFNKIVERGKNDERYKKYFKLLGLEKYENFKKWMVKRNIELFKMSENQIKENKQKEEHIKEFKRNANINQNKYYILQASSLGPSTNENPYNQEYQIKEIANKTMPKPNNHEEKRIIHSYETQICSTPLSVNQYFKQIVNQKINIDIIENEDSIIMEEKDDEVLDKK